MSKYRITYGDGNEAELMAVSESGAIDRYFDMKGGRIPKESMKAEAVK